MILSAIPLKNVTGVNDFEKCDEWTFSEGQTTVLYFQLINKDRGGIRYIPVGSAVELEVLFTDVNSMFDISLVGDRAFSEDLSIFKVTFDEGQVPHTGRVYFNITIDGEVKKFSVDRMISVELLEDGSC